MFCQCTTEGVLSGVPIIGRNTELLKIVLITWTEHFLGGTEHFLTGTSTT